MSLLSSNTTPSKRCFCSGGCYCFFTTDSQHDLGRFLIHVRYVPRSVACTPLQISPPPHSGIVRVNSLLFGRVESRLHVSSKRLGILRAVFLIPQVQSWDKELREQRTARRQGHEQGQIAQSSSQSTRGATENPGGATQEGTNTP